MTSHYWPLNDENVNFDPQNDIHTCIAAVI